ncbi:MAG TPA: flagellar motor protein MotB [Bacillota bacterium]|nr:flagellar motor protein MotB [Candidatus Fermentithermobacillaceae bacterium]HOQ03171.1 flagellar motor protein MotB [Bacillota bacterium]HPV13567.1 flagellar motor protein MotB [Bacillota bacterium]
MRRWMQDDDAPRQAPWMNTYADMVTLLLCFFVLLFSMSVIEIEKFQSVMSSLQGALGILDGGTIPSPEGPMPDSFDPGDLVAQLLMQEMAQMTELQHAIEEELKGSGLSDKVAVSLEERGVVIRFADTVLFDIGQDTLRPESREVLLKVGEIIKNIDNPVRIEGHTDNWPINTPQFPSNWELSTARATRVVRFLIEEAGIDPRQLQAAGYGEYHPIDSNLTAEGRRRNRRVDIVILRPSLSSAEPNQ